MYQLSEELFVLINKIIPVNSVILEFGSTQTTGRFDKYYLYSVEHDIAQLNKYKNTTYIYAPLKDYSSYKWYDTSYLRLPQHYDAVLINAPNGNIGKIGLYHNISILKNTKVPFFISDIQNNNENVVFNALSKKLNKQCIRCKTEDNKEFGYLL